MSESEPEQEPRAAPALVGAVVDGASLAATTSSPTMSSRSPEGPTPNVLPTYSESSTSERIVETAPGPSASSVQGFPSHAIAPGSDSFFDIAPRGDSTSFQVGYLGLKGFQAWLKGDVLIKLDNETKSKGRYTRCVVQLQAREQALGFYSHTSPGRDVTQAPVAPQNDEVELFSHTLVLWDADKEPTSSSAGLPIMPSTIPFSFPLTSDLPHCVHLRDSSLTYTITAELFSQDTQKLPHLTKTVPVHLVRYTRPGPLNEIELSEIDGAALPDDVYTLQPHNWVKQAPTLVYAQINRTIFRRAEPIDIRVRIPPPDPTSVSEKGLKLRAVEADLIRVIHVKRSDDDNIVEETTLANGTSSHPNTHEALLAHSGKLCRFHSQRPVLLRLTLHPPFDRANMPHPHPDHDALASGPVFGRGGGGGCESISQETLMHKVTFEVRIKIGIQGGRGERRDIICRRAIKILPGAAGALEDPGTDQQGGFSALTEKERLKRSEKARMLAQDDSAGASGSHSADNPSDLLNFGMDDEYDGYEDIGRSLNDFIDAANESDMAGSSAGPSDHAERLEQLRQFLDVSGGASHDDRPPPTLLESRNDLQVEVEVEGVGTAVPRLAYRHPADHYPDMDDMQNDSFPPPPPIDAAHQQPGDDLSSYTMLSISENEGSSLPPEDDDPPPPLSPLMSRSATQGPPDASHAEASDSAGLHMTGGFSRLDVRSSNLDRGEDFPPPPPHDSTQGYAADLGSSASASMPVIRYRGSYPSYEAAVASGFVPLRTRLRMEIERHGEPAHYEPPPYADGAGHTDPVPSFDQAIRQHSSEGGVTLPHSTQTGDHSREQEHDDELPLPPAHDPSNVQSADHHPPAYGTSPHPPSYDA